MKLSVVTTLYYSEPWTSEFYERITSAASKITNDFEVIFVNDGSPDNALNRALEIQERDARVVVADLSRNFGHHKAIKAGLSIARGDFVFLIDSDLEESPELLNRFWDRLSAPDHPDVVYGVQKRRKGTAFEKVSGRIFYSILNLLLTDGSYPEDTLTARLMTREYVEAVLAFDDREYDISWNFLLAGFVQIPVEVTKGHKRESQYTLTRKIRMATETITSSSSRPLVMIFLLGVFMSLFSFSYLAYVLAMKVFYDVLMGWTGIIASIWLIGGLVMLSLGVIGIYISKIFIETKKRPDFIIRKIYRGLGE